MTKYITHKQAIFLNGMLIRRYSPDEMIGVKDEAMLDSAIMRVQQSIDGEDAYPTLEMKGAALFASLAQNHPFYNANKRTAFACLYLFLHLNGYDLRVAEAVAEDFTIHVVTDKPELSVIARWIAENMLPET